MEWELNPSTWDLSQMELQDTAFGVSHHQGGVDGESATIFSVDLRLGSGLGLGIDDHYDNNNSSHNNNNNSCNAGGSCHGVPIMGADTPNRSSTSSRTEAPFSSKRGRGRAGGASDISRQNLSCLVDGCTSELSDSREYHRRHRVCEQHAKTPVVLIGGHQRRFCQQCSRFHSLGEFDDKKISCRKRLYVHNRRRRKSFLPGNSGSGSLEFKTTSQYGSAAGAMLNGGMNWPMVSPSEMPPPFTYSGHRYGTQLQPPVADRPTNPYPASSYWGGRYDYEIGSMSHQGMFRSDYAPSLLSPAASGGPSLVQQTAGYYSIMQSHETASSSLSSAHHLGESGSHGGSFP